MKPTKKRLLVVAIFAIICSCKDNNQNTFSYYEDAITPVVLGKGTLSNNFIGWNNVYVPKTKELFYTKMEGRISKIMVRKFTNNSFREAQKINYPDSSSHSDIYVNTEGNIMLFSSQMLENEKDTVSDWKIWKSVRKKGVWQSPNLFFSQNIVGNQFYPWLTNSGNLYFAITPHGSRNSDIYVSEYKNGQYKTPQALSKKINTNDLEGDAFVSKDEHFMIFSGFRREHNLGKSDLYISFNKSGNWSLPIWLGKEINSNGYDGSPFVTDDGKFLIFTSSRGSTDDKTYFNHYIVKFNIEKYKLK